MTKRSRTRLFLGVLPPPASKAIIAIFIGAGVVAALLYISGGSSYLFGQVVRHSECAANDTVCLQQLNARTRVLNHCNRGDSDCAFVQLNALARETGYCNLNIECLRRQAIALAGQSSLEPITNRSSFSSPPSGIRPVYAGQTYNVNVPGRYDYVTLYRLYPKAIKFCQNPTASRSLDQYIGSKLSAFLGSRVTRGEWLSVFTQSLTSSTPTPTPTTRLFIDSGGRVPTGASQPPTSPASPTTSPSLLDEFLVDGATLAPPYEPPVPYGNRAADGCWYFRPTSTSGIHQFTIPADAANGEATITILEGMLQPNYVVEREVRDTLRAALGRFPTDDEVRVALAARPDRYSERVREYTVEEVFMQVVTDTQPAAQVVSSGGSFERGAVRSATCPTDYQIVRAQICQGSNVYTENQCVPVTVTTPRAGTVRYTVPATYPNGYIAHIIGYNQAGQACFRERVTIGSVPSPTPTPRRFNFWSSYF